MTSKKKVEVRNPWFQAVLIPYKFYRVVKVFSPGTKMIVSKTFRGSEYDESIWKEEPKCCYEIQRIRCKPGTQELDNSRYA